MGHQRSRISVAVLLVGARALCTAQNPHTQSDNTPGRSDPRRAGSRTLQAQDTAAGRQVRLIRIDSSGKVWTRAFTYNASRFQQLSYPPFNPAASKPGAAAPAAAPTAAGRSKAAPAATNGRQSPLPAGGGLSPPVAGPNSPKAPCVLAQAAAAAARGRRLAAQRQQRDVSNADVGQRSSQFLLQLLHNWAPTRQLQRLVGGWWRASQRHGPAQAGSSSPAQQQRLLSQQTVFSPDSRVACPAKQFPFTALGELTAPLDGVTLVCTGALVAPGRLLTAGDCVWNDRAAAGKPSIFQNLTIRWPGLAISGAAWDHITLFQSFVESPNYGDGLQHDIAVIALKQPVGLQTGWLGIRTADDVAANCTAASASSAPVTLSLAGYPGSMLSAAAGNAGMPSSLKRGSNSSSSVGVRPLNVSGCLTTQCAVNISACSPGLALHLCDSSTGQSGAPMFDAQGFVRAVHFMGQVDGVTTQNSAIRVSKYMLDNLMGYWAESSSFKPADNSDLYGGGDDDDV